jgi:basic membrane lipoprotein Med (substrate-binding protein (PBP1-ABC) superfamily)
MSPARPVSASGKRGLAARLLRRRWWVAAAVVVLIGAVAVIVVIALRPRPRYLPPSRAREYRDYTACLLTGPQALTDSGAKAAWAGMQDASATTLIQVSYLAAAGPETMANVSPYAAALVQRRCDLIVAVGPVEVDAAAQQAAAHLEIRFVLVAAEVGGGRGGANVTMVPAGDPKELRSAVAGVVGQAPAR